MVSYCVYKAVPLQSSFLLQFSLDSVLVISAPCEFGLVNSVQLMNSARGMNVVVNRPGGEVCSNGVVKSSHVHVNLIFQRGKI